MKGIPSISRTAGKTISLRESWFRLSVRLKMSSGPISRSCSSEVDEVVAVDAGEERLVAVRLDGVAHVVRGLRDRRAILGVELGVRHRRRVVVAVVEDEHSTARAHDGRGGRRRDRLGLLIRAGRARWDFDRARRSFDRARRSFVAVLAGASRRSPGRSDVGRSDVGRSEFGSFVGLFMHPAIRCPPLLPS